MKNKIISALLVIVTGAAVFLLFQNIQLKKQLNNATEPVQDKIAPVVPPTKPANPIDVSPFDKPNEDPKANEFKPNGTAPDKSTSIRFDNLTYDFGRVNEGEKVHTQFKFTNTGEWALIIDGAKGSCGCTVPMWPKEPVKPGASGVIDVSFDSKGKRGENKKTVTVVSNTNPAITTLIITSTVIPHDR